MPRSIKTTLQTAALRLGTEEAKLEAQLLLQHLLGVNRAWLITHEEDVLQPQGLSPQNIPTEVGYSCVKANTHAEFEALLARRLQGEPMAYILGQREFYGLNLMVSPDTLIPRPDTETLVEVALGKIPQDSTPSSFRRRSESSGFQKNQDRTRDSDLRQNDSFNILDLGTGSGAIALAIAKNRPQANVVAVDASPASLEIAKKNAVALQISNVKFISSDWFTALAGMRFDVIVSNPPYIEQTDPHLTQGDLRFEPMSALASGTDGLDDIRRIVTESLIHLKPQGWLMLEHGYQQAEAVSDLMAQAGLVEIKTIRDLGNNDRVTLGKNPLIVNTHWA